eukprot:CAMPEP_0194035502 /NCGR_PEP_ID=MMETSP0009_2-20130614/7924_1 /TAXON_ID=210454 /ORGANISM="Grammatophora oceanica, Strain CCMP 410" /LENGTH=470 /DNA_ID=CAMNT_0038676885 /DNA_START=17 /DNA_END=1429 /DNA_ORIENTATION=-
MSTEVESMDVEPTTPAVAAPATTDEDEEELGNLMELVDQAAETTDPASKIPTLQKILKDEEYNGPKAIQLKERAVYDLTRAYCQSKQYSEVIPLLKETPLFNQVTKAKCAKIVRAVLDLVQREAPLELEMQADICRNIRAWCQREKRTFLRQRVEAKLASILVEQELFGQALDLIDPLLVELKKLDDKQLLVEAHLMEAKIHFGLKNKPKSKAALTASRTAANSIYVSPSLQATIDSMSGILYTSEGEYDTAHSYFLEAFEQLDQLGDKEGAVPCLKYMMLCRILDSLTKALNLSAKGGVGAKSSKSDVDISGMISGRQGVKYAGSDIEAMTAIAGAASRRSLQEFESVLQKYPKELKEDLLIDHHLHVLQEQLLESNLIRIIEPYSCVEISHIASLMEMPVAVIEKKLSQMILDGKFKGILDQGKGQLIVYEDSEKDRAMEKSLEVIANMDNIVSSLFERSKALRTMMI